jgi:mono/diheme cytochrome c family protein
MRKGALAAILAATALAASCASEPAATEPVARGRQVYRELSCGSCHEGSLLNFFRAVGPPLDHIGTVAETRRPGVPAADYIRQSVTDPGAYVVPGYPDSMPRGLGDRISREDLDALVAYLLSLR